MIPLVMCIDDDPIVLFLNDLVLKDQAFCSNIIKFEKAEHALDYFKDQAATSKETVQLPNLIFLDINMPVMDGWEFLDAFMQRFPDYITSVKVVILSSSVNPADIKIVNNHPMVISFMPKPIVDEELESLKKHPLIAQYF